MIIHSYGLDEWFWAIFGPNWTLPNFSFGQLFMWIRVKNGLDVSELMFEPRCIWAMFEPTWPNFSFGQLFMLIGANNNQNDFVWARWVILSNVQTYFWTWPYFTSGQLFMWIGQIMTRYDFLWAEWFWAMFGPTWTWPNFPMVNFSCELGKIMTRYDFIWSGWVIQSNVWTDLKVDLIYFLVNL